MPALSPEVRKRALDLALSAILIVPALPVIGLCALAVRLDSPGPAFYAQRRVGRGGAPFVCLKLRTMHAETGERPSHEIPASATTRVGRILRRNKLDELPQLWNVLRGEMSLVGPRPSLPSQVELIEERRRLGVLDQRPGITGVSQVAGIDMSDPVRLAASDASYRPGLAADLRILFATLTGAGRGDRVTR